jgi:hypothetical protein
MKSSAELVTTPAGTQSETTVRSSAEPADQNPLKLTNLHEGLIVRHFKTGKLYEVMAIANCSAQTGRRYVVYRDIHEGTVYIRPAERVDALTETDTPFCDLVEKAGRKIRRFDLTSQ